MTRKKYTEERKVWDKQYRERNKKRRAEYDKNYRNANAEEYKSKKRAYYHANKDKVYEKIKAYQQANKEKVREWKKEYAKRNPEVRRKAKRKRRAKEQSVLSEPYTTEEVLALYGTDCFICSKPINLDAPRQCGKPGWRHALHIDHLIPISRGGSDTLDNVRPTHGECNIHKSMKLLEELLGGVK
jgi:5-methylcytosine-specific restriction endonuclease McrA